MVVDFDGRILAQAEPGPGERIVVGPIDVTALRAERERRHGHHMLAHLRTELYRDYSTPIYPRAQTADNWPLTIEGNNRVIADAKTRSPRSPE
jgi:hypothetical protein